MKKILLFLICSVFNWSVNMYGQKTVLTESFTQSNSLETDEFHTFLGVYDNTREWVFGMPTDIGDEKQSFAFVNVSVSALAITVPKSDYYVDATNGNDANNGSLTFPWKSISKVNSLIFSAGSRIFFKSGETWSGQLIPKGLGTSAEPTIIGKYGNGANPIINGIGITGKATIYLENQQFWEVSDLEITNYPGLIGDFDVSTGGDRRGVFVAISGFGTANHIYLKNLNIHHVRGQDGSGSTAINGAIPKRTGGIYFAVLDTEGPNDKSRFNDILIDGCTIAYCDNTGLTFDNEWNVFYPGGQKSLNPADVVEYQNWYDRRNTNLLIKNNTIHHIAKNAIIIRMADETGLIERNVCYETAIKTTGNTMFTARCKGTVFQYNEGYLNRATSTTGGTIDGSMYDADLGSVGIIFQYSYSHDNSEGLFWGCNARSQSEVNSGIPDPNDAGTTVRYNISQNDLGDLIFFNYPSAGNEIYNNTFYIGAGKSPNIIHENGRTNHTYNFYNNIIYNISNEKTGAKYGFGTGTGVQTRSFSHNLFYGSHPVNEPSDAFKITTDPLFVSPGIGNIGINTLNGYRLKSTSPAINSGVVIPNNGGLDYWSNPLYKNAPDIGAHETNAPVLADKNLCCCTASSTTLQANCGGSDVPLWYDSEVGGNLLATGNSYTTPSLNSATSYYVSCKSSVNNVENSPRSVIKVTLSIPTALINGGGTICAGETLNLRGDGGIAYAWTGPNGFMSSQQNPNIPNLTTSFSGIYTLKVTDINACSTITTTTVLVNPKPPKPTVLIENTALKSSSAINNQWYLGGIPIKDATGQYFNGFSSGAYTVKVIENGCFSESDAIIITGIEQDNNNLNIKLYPNPNEGTFWVELPQQHKLWEIEVFDLNGKCIYSKVQTSSNANKEQINIKLNSGIYFLRVTFDKLSQAIKFFVNY